MKASRLQITRLAVAAVLLSAAVLAQSSAAARIRTIPIINVYSHRPVDIYPGGVNASKQRFASAFLWKYPEKEFELIYSAEDTKAFKIHVPYSDLCLMLDFRPGPYKNGTRVIQYSCDANKSAKWWYAKKVIVDAPPGEPQSDYPYMLKFVNRFTGKCLDADNRDGGSPPKAAVLQQWDCFVYSDDWNIGNQLWRDYE